MARTLSVELTDAEYAALAHIAVDPEDWFQDMVRLRCRNTIAEIADAKIQEMIADPTVASIPADKTQVFETEQQQEESSPLPRWTQKKLKECNNLYLPLAI